MRSGPGQTSAGAARCTRCDRRGSARSSAVDSTFRGRAPADAQAAGSSAKPLRGITSIPAQMSSATERGSESRPGRLEPSPEQRHNEPKPVVPPSGTRGRPRPRSRIVEEHSSRRPTPVGLRPRPGGGHASRDRTQESARDWQRYVGLLRCFSRRRSQRIPTPALAWSRQPPWELVPGSPLPVRPSNVAGD